MRSRGDRIIGMVLLQPGHEADYEGRPPVFPVGCAGVITHSEPLDDGRFNIVLRGMERFRIAGEDSGKPYRIAQVSGLPEDRARGGSHRAAPPSPSARGAAGGGDGAHRIGAAVPARGAR